jgi:hypothetical protein
VVGLPLADTRALLGGRFAESQNEVPWRATQRRKRLRESAAKRLKALARANMCARLRVSSLLEACVGSGLGQRPADFEPKVVHRGLLAH